MPKRVDIRPGWLLRQVLASVAVVLLGAVLGMLLGKLVNAPGAGAVLGAVGAVSIHAARRAIDSRRILHWLPARAGDEVPRVGGAWGEVAYRIDRAFRARDRRFAQQDQRLEQFLSAIDASPNGVLMLDRGDHIEWCNSVAAQHFGLSPEGDLRQRITNLVRAPAFVAYLHAGVFHEPVRFPSSRSHATLSVIARPYGDGMKLLLSQDVTESDRNESMRRDFVANVSHEIRTPLTVLAGFIETLATLPLDSAERDRVMELMAQQTDRMQSLVGDLLTLAQLEGSPRPAADRWLAVEPLLQRIVADAQALSAGRHAISLDSDDAAEVAGVASELTSAVANLVNNAVRYTPAGKAIHIRWLQRVDGSGEVEVEDGGIGIAPEHLGRLTERFYRVDHSRSRDTGGTGLGLSIVKHVIQRHGGELEIRSRPGVGSSFKLTLPPARVRWSSPPAASAAAVTVDSAPAAL